MYTEQESIFYGLFMWRFSCSTSHYLENEKEFKLLGISFPMSLKDIPKFGKVNNDSVPVYGYQEGKEEDIKILVL